MSERISIGNAEDKHLKRKMIEESKREIRKESKNTLSTSQVDLEKGKMIEEAESKLHKELKVITSSIESKNVLPLRLDNDTKPTSNLLENGEHSSSSENIIVEVLSKEVNKYSCLFCNKTFSNLQALGGHQNAHKRERDLRKNKQKRKEEEMDSTIKFKLTFSNPCPYSRPSPRSGSSQYQGYSYFCDNEPIGTHMDNTNTVSSLLGSPSGSYGGMDMPNTPSPPHPFVMSMSKSPLTIPQFRMNNYLGGNQTPVLPILQRSNIVELELFGQPNQTPLSDEGTEGSFNVQFSSHNFTKETRDFVSEGQFLAEVNVSSSSTESEELDLNLKL